MCRLQTFTSNVPSNILSHSISLKFQCNREKIKTFLYMLRMGEIHVTWTNALFKKYFCFSFFILLNIFIELRTLFAFNNVIILQRTIIILIIYPMNGYKSKTINRKMFECMNISVFRSLWLRWFQPHPPHQSPRYLVQSIRHISR